MSFSRPGGGNCHLLLRVSLFVAAAVWLGYLAVGFIGCSRLGFSSVRLAAALALVKGLPCYPEGPGDAGLITIYPPTFGFIYAPTALFSTPFGALLCASVINLVVVVVPAVFLVRRLLRQHLTTSVENGVIAPVVLFLLLLFAWLEPLQAIQHIHCEAIALGCLTLAILVLQRPASKGSWWAAAVLLTLSATSKQTYVMAFPAVALWIGWHRGWRAFWEFSAMAAISLLGVILVLGCRFGFHTLYFNCVEVAARHPWIDRAALLGEVDSTHFVYGTAQRLQSLLALVYVGVRDQGWFLLLTGALIISAFFSRQGDGEKRAGSDLAVLLLLVTLFQLPLAMLGFVKAGGAPNNLASPTFFWAILFAAAFGLWTIRGGENRVLLLALAILLLSVQVGTQTAFRAVRQNCFEQDQVYRYLLDHPERNAYFPFEPLAHLLAQNRLVPASSTYWDLDLAGFRSTPENDRRRLGFQPGEIIMTPSMYGYENILQRWPQYRPTTDGPPLPPGYVRLVPASP